MNIENIKKAAVKLKKAEVSLELEHQRTKALAEALTSALIENNIVQSSGLYTDIINGIYKDLEGALNKQRDIRTLELDALNILHREMNYAEMIAVPI